MSVEVALGLLSKDNLAVDLITCKKRSIYLTLICLFIVSVKRIMKYITKIGQNTGMLRASKNVHTMAMTIDLV